ncbi:MAG: T9SS type A sorting domain-containing protein [Bacteroidota bacterium]
MRKLYLLFILLFAFTQISFGQTTITFDGDDTGAWSMGSGDYSTYQIDHEYNISVNDFDVKFTGGPALRETQGPQDGYAKTLSGNFSWKLRDRLTVEWSVTLNATKIDGFSFYVRRWDNAPKPDYDVFYSTDGSSYFLAGTIDETFFLLNPEWKKFEYLSSISGGNIIKILIMPNGRSEAILIDDFTFINPLPVELTTFTAKAFAKGVKLNWSTATEVNNYGFEVQRSEGRDQKSDWEKIDFVEGHGNSNSPKDYSFVDKAPTFGEVSYRLKQIDTDGAFEYSDVVTVTSQNLAKNELLQNHPNPFNPSTVISFSLAELSHVNISVYNAIGQKVVELANEQMDAGFHNVNFDGSNLSTGFYFYRLETPNYSKTMKMMLVK